MNIHDKYVAVSRSLQGTRILLEHAHAGKETWVNVELAASVAASDLRALQSALRTRARKELRAACPHIARYRGGTCKRCGAPKAQQAAGPQQKETDDDPGINASEGGTMTATEAIWVTVHR